jgi:hypothetical protein
VKSKVHGCIPQDGSRFVGPQDSWNVLLSSFVFLLSRAAPFTESEHAGPLSIRIGIRLRGATAGVYTSLLHYARQAEPPYCGFPSAGAISPRLTRRADRTNST